MATDGESTVVLESIVLVAPMIICRLHFSFQMVPVQALLTREERVSAGFLRYAKKTFPVFSHL